MKHEKFSIGCHFFNAKGKWRCTDVGTRTIVAIELDDHSPDVSWLYGPPYNTEEVVFNEEDLKGCHFADVRIHKLSTEYKKDDKENQEQQ